MEYLKISNQTLIEPNAFKLLGACTKRDDATKIGYFGSGLKYGIAVLLRKNIDFVVYSGLQKIDISLKSEIFREKAFNVIHIAGEKTSLTTDMGIDWELWQAIREVYCNALDETNSHHCIINEICPKENETAFYISLENKDMADLIQKWDTYFSFNRRMLVGDENKIFDSISDKVNVYRKGIRCYDEFYASLYDYDFDNISINESRVVKWGWEVKEKLAELWGKYATKSMIRNLLSNREDKTATYIEDTIDWRYATGFSHTWLDYFKDKILVPQSYAGWFTDIVNSPEGIVVPDKLCRYLLKAFPDDMQSAIEHMDESSNFCSMKPNKKQQFLLKECLHFLEEVKLNVPYPISIGAFQNKTTLACAKNDKIILSDKLFDKGRKAIVCAIIEEYAHIESGKADETRGFQNYLISEIVTLLENYNGIFL